MKTITIATRGSRLALWQAEHISSLLEERHNVSCSLLVLKTKGDIILDVPLAKVGGKGLFVKEIEEALLDGRADIAVHSMKDVPMELPEGLVLGAVPVRENPADVLLSAKYPSLESLPPKAKVGTSSLRRQAQLLSLRPDLQILSLRGNVDTRLRKLMAGDFEAIVMAAAGMARLGLEAPYMSVLDPHVFLPAAGQGALGIEFRADREDLKQLLAFINHWPTEVCVAAERGFLAGLEGGCQVPIAAHARLSEPFDASEPELILDGLTADVNGGAVVRKIMRGSPAEARSLGFSLAEAVKAAGGDILLRDLYQGEKK